ncbi:MAG: hypothetical protein ABIJ86_01165 [Spirochaetota bacterium]
MRTKKVYFLVAFVAFGALVSGYAQQTVTPSQNAAVTIRGTVPQILKLELDFATLIPLDLAVGGTTALGTANLVSNLLGNYTVSVASANGGTLLGAIAGNTDAFPYTFNFGVDSVSLAGSAYTLTTSGKTSKAGVPYVVSVNLTGTDALPELVVADTYEDVLTFTIAAN